MNEPKIKQVNMKLSTVFFVMFASSCGGCFGLENMVSVAGPGYTIFMMAVIPFVWAIPFALMCAELGAAIPLNGGCYVWVQRALGNFWAFQIGWFRTLVYYVFGSISMVLAVGYISTFFNISKTEGWLIGVGIIAVCAIVNICGLKLVGWTSYVFSAFVMVPFLLLVVIGVFKMHLNPFTPFFATGANFSSNIGYVFAIGVWMYAGFESVGSYAAEIKNSATLIPKAMVLVLISMVAIYTLPVIVGLGVVGNYDQWMTDGGISIVQVAGAIGGSILGTIMFLAAIFANVIFFSDILASVSRTFYVMSHDGQMPKFFGKLSKKYGTPYMSIIFMAVVTAIISTGTFDKLIVFNVFFLMITVILILISGIVLRIKEPDLPRPYKIRGGTPWLITICIPPLIIAICSMFMNGTAAIYGGIIGALTGPIVYFVFRKAFGGGKSQEFHGE